MGGLPDAKGWLSAGVFPRPHAPPPGLLAPAPSGAALRLALRPWALSRPTQTDCARRRAGRLMVWDQFLAPGSCGG